MISVLPRRAHIKEDDIVPSTQNNPSSIAPGKPSEGHGLAAGPFQNPFGYEIGPLKPVTGSTGSALVHVLTSSVIIRATLALAKARLTGFRIFVGTSCR
jgi:hypothetical protein